MKESKNQEQLEAEEINTLPRIVITADGMNAFPIKGQEFTFEPLHMIEIAHLVQLCGKHRREAAG